MFDPLTPGHPPGERRLDRPPSGRYAPSPPTDDVPPAASVVRASLYGDLAGAAGAVAIVVLAGVLAIGAGLIVVAAAVGRFVGLGVRAGGGGALPSRVGPTIAIVTSLAAVGAGQVGTWLYARSEGGVLDLADYLGQTFGWLVPVQFAIAALVAWWSAR
jgi:hypothetical protein